MSPFQMWKTMKGNVWTRASTYMANEIQRWKTCTFPYEIPVSMVMKLTSVDVAKTKGRQAIDIQPERVAIGGELPYEMLLVFGQ